MGHLSMLRKQFPPVFGNYPPNMNFVAQNEGQLSSDEENEEPAIAKRQKLAPE